MNQQAARSFVRIRHLALAALLPMFFLGAAACGDDDSGGGNGPYNLTFSGSGYEPHDGQTIYIAVVDVAANTVIQTDQVVVSGGSISFTWVGILEKDKSYRIDLYADVDGDGECDSPPDDHVWSESVQSVTGDQNVVRDHNATFTASACDSFPQGPLRFDITFNGNSFGPHDMQMIHAALVRVDNGNVVEEGSTTVSGGTFSFTWPGGVEEGKAYRIDYYADVDGDGFCADPDHIWRVEIPAVTGVVTVDETHSTSFTPAACDSFEAAQTFDLTFDGSSFGPHDMQTLHVALVMDADDSVVATDSVVISGGEFSFSWADALTEGKAYRLDFYADVDGSTTCADPDHIWSREIPAVSDDVAVDVTHDTMFTPAACDSF